MRHTLADVSFTYRMPMDNPSTIPSQLGQMNTIPSVLGPAGGDNRRQQAPSTMPAGLKWLLPAVAVAVLFYFAR